jgi:hypothetical protein
MMASIKDVIEGLEILAKTATVPVFLAEQGSTDRREAHLIGADRGIVYGPESDPSQEDKTKLDELGWFFDDESDCWARFV